MEQTYELINEQMERAQSLFWDREAARKEYRAARRESREKKQGGRARSKARMASIEEKLREEYAALRDMLNAVLEEEA